TKCADLADRLTAEKADAKQVIAERVAALDAANVELMAALKKVAELEHLVAGERGESHRLKEQNLKLEKEAQRLDAEVLRLQQSDQKGK
ncbi:hypothetical protein, partial [Klebsiella pneumoniae]|uniref:hypothetical protein n=1 Tax=Klebsiella pneumoniae TaxID=573 RepID=UPI00273049B2